MSPSAMPDAEDTRRHFVYWVFAADNDELLYIGCTRDVRGRVQHLSHSSTIGNPVNAEVWRRGVGRVESQRYPNKAEARQAEREAIYAEAPLLNKQHNSRRYSKKRGPGAVPMTPRPCAV